jgi:hypothetical protein
MPPRCDDQLEAAAVPACDPFAALPLALALALFALLPVDQRMRCAEVCRSWRAALSDASLWLRLDLSSAGGIAYNRGIALVTEALLFAAAKRAAGGLQALNLTGCSTLLHALRAVAAENTAALVELRMATLDDTKGWWALDSAQFELLLRAAPQLRVLEADVHCDGVREARRLLRNEAPFGPFACASCVWLAWVTPTQCVHSSSTRLRTRGSLA